MTTHSVFFCRRIFVLHLPSTSTTLPQILQVWPLLIVQLSSEMSPTQRNRSCYPSLCWPLHYVHQLPWFISGCYFPLFSYFSTCSAECPVPSLYLPPPTLNMNSGAHSCPCRGLGIGCLMHNYWIQKWVKELRDWASNHRKENYSPQEDDLWYT